MILMMNLITWRLRCAVPRSMEILHPAAFAPGRVHGRAGIDTAARLVTRRAVTGGNEPAGISFRAS